MLRQLSIRDVVLIEALDLEFEAGLGVLTGETGAGKSILLDALGLALGARADTGLVRSGQGQAVVAASFEVAGDHDSVLLLAEQGIEAEPGEALGRGLQDAVAFFGVEGHGGDSLTDVVILVTDRNTVNSHWKRIGNPKV